MITNETARDQIAARIASAKNGKRRGHGHAFRTDYTRAAWLAVGEKAVGLLGGKAWMAIYSPAGWREEGSVDRVLFYDGTATLAHEQVADAEMTAWFNAAFARAA